MGLTFNFFGFATIIKLATHDNPDFWPWSFEFDHKSVEDIEKLRTVYRSEGAGRRISEVRGHRDATDKTSGVYCERIKTVEEILGEWRVLAQ